MPHAVLQTGFDQLHKNVFAELGDLQKRIDQLSVEKLELQGLVDQLQGLAAEAGQTTKLGVLPGSAQSVGSNGAKVSPRRLAVPPGDILEAEMTQISLLDLTTDEVTGEPNGKQKRTSQGLSENMKTQEGANLKAALDGTLAREFTIEKWGMKWKTSLIKVGRDNVLCLPKEREEFTAECIISNPIFNICASMVIFLNAVIIGWEVQYMTDHDTPLVLIDILGSFCNFYFLCELILRLVALRSKFWKGEDSFWNFFDAILVALSLADVSLLAGGGGDSLSTFSGLKTLRVLRIARVFRFFRSLKKLTLLAIMIIESMKDLFWAMVMLVLVIYVFSILLTASVSTWLKEQPAEGLDSVECTSTTMIEGCVQIHVSDSFGSLAKTAYTLVVALLGGADWKPHCDRLAYIDWSCGLLFISYIVIVILAVLNIITGVFVDNAAQAAGRQRDIMIEHEMASKEQFVKQISHFFSALDKDGSGSVTLPEVKHMMEDESMAAYFRILGFDIHDAIRLFNLLDRDNSGEIGIQEFLEGCIRLRGTARSVDMHTLISELRRLQKTLVTSTAVTAGDQAATPSASMMALKLIFESIDQDGDGKVTGEELRMKLQSDDQVGLLLTAAGKDGGNNILEQLDQDGDGELSWPEFLKMLTAESTKSQDGS